MALKKDKQKVLNETIDDTRLAEFFKLQPPAGIDADYHILERAYRGLQAPDFDRFVKLFVAQGHNINAKGPHGTMLEVINTHVNGTEYAQAIQDALES